MFTGWFGKAPPEASSSNGKPPGGNDDPIRLVRGADGRLRPKTETRKRSASSFRQPNGETFEMAGDDPKPDPTGGNTFTHLNQKMLEAAQFANQENASGKSGVSQASPELMVGTATGLMVQDATNYMNAIMQIAVAGQAVAIKLAAAGDDKPVPTLMTDVQNMVTNAIAAYKSITSDAGKEAAAVISDLEGNGSSS